MNDKTYINNWIVEFVCSPKYNNTEIIKNINTFLDGIEDDVEAPLIIDKFIVALNCKFARNLNTNRQIATMEKDKYSRLFSRAIIDFNAINEIIDFMDGANIIGEGLWTKIIKILGPKDNISTEDALFVCCPTRSKKAFIELKNFQGEKLIFIGEDRGGNTANDAFYDLLEEQWTKVKHVFIPIWVGWFDYVQMYERKF